MQSIGVLSATYRSSTVSRYHDDEHTCIDNIARLLKLSFGPLE